jgi:hypothetical protein
MESKEKSRIVCLYVPGLVIRSYLPWILDPVYDDQFFP